MSNEYKEEDVFSQDGLPPREQVSQWANVKKEIGDKVMGEFLGWWISPATDSNYNDQIGVALKITNTKQNFKNNKGEALEVKEGEVLGISLSDTSYMRERIAPSVIGDVVGIKYEADKDTGKPQPAKIVKFYNPDLEKRREAGTIVDTEPEVLKAPKDTVAPEETAVSDEANEDDLDF